MLPSDQTESIVNWSGGKLNRWSVWLPFARKNNDEFVKLYLPGERSLRQEEIERGSVFPRTGKSYVRVWE